MPPDPPSCKRLQRLGKIYSRAYSFKIPRYAPAGDVQKNPGNSNSEGKQKTARVSEEPELAGNPSYRSKFQ